MHGRLTVSVAFCFVAWAGSAGVSPAGAVLFGVENWDGSVSSCGCGEATLIIEGGLLDMSDPRQSDALARALESLSGRRVTIVGG